MVNKDTDFFHFTNNFADIADVVSICLIRAKIDYIPKITIAIPTFKRPNLLKDAIDSVIAQINYANYDIIIVDNDPERGCPTEKLIHSYDHPKLSYYKNAENIGMFGNWNRCFELARGEWVTLLHDDDYLLSNFCLEMMNFLECHQNLQALSCIIHPWQDTGKISISAVAKNIMPQYNGKKITKKITNKITLYDQFFLNNISAVGLIFKRKKIIELGGFNPQFFPSSDYVMTTRYIKKCGDIVQLNKKLVVYRLLINESIKEEVQTQTIYNDFYLRIQIAQFIHLPYHIAIELQYGIASSRLLNLYCMKNNTIYQLINDNKTNSSLLKIFAIIVQHFIYSLLKIKNKLYKLI